MSFGIIFLATQTPVSFRHRAAARQIFSAPIRPGTRQGEARCRRWLIGISIIGGTGWRQGRQIGNIRPPDIERGIGIGRCLAE